MISDASAQDDDNHNNVPVAAPNEVADVIGLTMQWYFDSISSTVPTAERTEDGVSMPRNDMPTFRIDSQALSGVDAVVGNALMSTRWVDATTNLAKSVEMTARFVGNAADRDGEGFDYLKELIQNVRVHGFRGAQRRPAGRGEGAATDHAGGLQRGFPAERDADGGAAVVRPVVRAMGRYAHVRL